MFVKKSSADVIDAPTAAAATTTRWVHIPTPGDHYSPRTGSAVITVIREITKCHTAAGGRSRVLVARGTWDGFDDGVREEIDFRRTGTPSRWAKALDGTIGALLGRRPISGRVYLDAARALGSDYDGAVFVHNEPSGIEPIARSCPRAKVVLWMHNELFRTYTPRQTRRVVDRAYRVICCSDYIAGTVRAKIGPTARLRTVLNGVDTSVFRASGRPHAADHAPVVLFVGRMVPEKGVHLLLQAARLLKADGVRFKLRLVGSANFNAADALSLYERNLHDLTDGLRDVTEFLPFQSRSALVSIYQMANVLCVPSDWEEPFGLVVLEGRACGLEIVASRRGGIPESAGTSANFFEPPDIIQLANCLKAAIIRSTVQSPSVRSKAARATGIGWTDRYAALAGALSLSN